MLTSKSTKVLRHYFVARLRSAASIKNGRFISTDSQAPSSFSHDKMAADKRYQGTSEVPSSLLGEIVETSEFSIRGQFRKGRAAYLDMSSTTPLDPRVLDAMAPFMVGHYVFHSFN